MTESKKGIGKAKIGLVTSAVLVVILAVSSVWLYARVDNLQKQVDSLKTNKNNVHVFQHMPDATLSQSNPTSGTKYTVLNTTKNARIISIAVKCTWTVQPTPLKIHITIDGQSLTTSENNPANNTWYYIRIEGNYANPDLGATDYGFSRAFLLEGRSIKIEAEVTGGTVSDLSARVKYAIIP